jgi:serine/threonine protein phosphatase PrpC
VARIPLPPPPASPKSGSRADAWAPLSSLAAVATPAGAEPPSLLLAAVMDGHGGWQASDYVQAHIAGVLSKELAHASDPSDPEQLAAALSRTFERLDRDFIARVKPAFEVRAPLRAAWRKVLWRRHDAHSP